MGRGNLPWAPKTNRGPQFKKLLSKAQQFEFNASTAQFRVIINALKYCLPGQFLLFLNNDIIGFQM